MKQVMIQKPFHAAFKVLHKNIEAFPFNTQTWADSENSKGKAEPLSRNNCFLTGSVPVFLREPIATCDFSGVGIGIQTHCPPLNLPMTEQLF